MQIVWTQSMRQFCASDFFSACFARRLFVIPHLNLWRCTAIVCLHCSTALNLVGLWKESEEENSLNLLPQKKVFSYASAKKIMLLYAKKLQLLSLPDPLPVLCSWTPMGDPRPSLFAPPNLKSSIRS